MDNSQIVVINAGRKRTYAPLGSALINLPNATTGDVFQQVTTKKDKEQKE